jgi:uncharacterized OsmC-like protein
MRMAQTQYTVQGRSTDTFGRVLCNTRNQHFVVDGPIQNGCPGEAITPAELFLSGVAACGVELLQVIAREQDLPLQRVAVQIEGVIDRENPARTDLMVFNEVRLNFRLTGVTQEQAGQLVAAFQRR